MALYRAQAVHQHMSGLPRDRFVNTFHVVTGGAPSEAVAEQIAEHVRDFYVVNPGGGAEDVADQFSDVVAATGHEVRVYPIDTATGENLAGDGEPPMWVETFDHLGRNIGARDGLPSEVAICLSYKNVSAGGVPVARRRGRIYVGPIYKGIPVEAAHNRPSVQAGTRTFLLTAAQELAARLGADGYTWSIYSRPFAGRGVIVRPGRPDLPAIAARPGATYPIEKFWVDDAFDIQRRRGEHAVSRTLADVL